MITFFQYLILTYFRYFLSYKTPSLITSTSAGCQKNLPITISNSLLFTLLFLYFLSVLFTPDLRVKRTGGKNLQAGISTVSSTFSLIFTACSQQPPYHLSLSSPISCSYFDDHQVLSRTLINTDTEVSRLSFSRATTIQVNATRTIHRLFSLMPYFRCEEKKINVHILFRL